MPIVTNDNPGKHTPFISAPFSASQVALAPARTRESSRERSSDPRRRSPRSPMPAARPAVQRPCTDGLARSGVRWRMSRDAERRPTTPRAATEMASSHDVPYEGSPSSPVELPAFAVHRRHERSRAETPRCVATLAQHRGTRAHRCIRQIELGQLLVHEGGAMRRLEARRERIERDRVPNPRPARRTHAASAIADPLGTSAGAVPARTSNVLGMERRRDSPRTTSDVHSRATQASATNAPQTPTTDHCGAQLRTGLCAPPLRCDRGTAGGARRA